MASSGAADQCDAVRGQAADAAAADTYDVLPAASAQQARCERRASAGGAGDGDGGAGRGHVEVAAVAEPAERQVDRAVDVTRAPLAGLAHVNQRDGSLAQPGGERPEAPRALADRGEPGPVKRDTHDPP